jgi:hypothetical protein
MATAINTADASKAPTGSEAIAHRLIEAKATAEVAYAYDPAKDSARVLGVNIGRNYQLKPGEIAGTADVVMVNGDCVTVYDWKTGHKALPHPSESWQLRALALAACRTTGAGNAIIGYGRVADEEAPVLVTDTMDCFDLDWFAGELFGLLAAADRALKDYTEHNMLPRLAEGPQCDYCEAFAFCPAKHALARSMAADLAGLEAGIEALTLEQAGSVLEKVQAAEAVLERIKSSLKERAQRTPIPLPSGGRWAAVETRRESVDGRVALAALAEHIGWAEASKAVKTLTKEAIKSAAGEKATEILQTIRNRGGIRQSVFAQMRTLNGAKE